jgi:hypothetical protein
VLLLTIMHTEATPTPIIPNITLNFLSKFFCIPMQKKKEVLLFPPKESSSMCFFFFGVKGHGTRCVLSSAVPAFCERRKIYRKRRKIYPLLLTSGERFTHSY